MDPIAFSVFGFEIRWYGILISLGILIGLYITTYTCKLKNIDYEKFLNTLLISLPIGFIGARIYYVLFNLPYYDSFLEMINIRKGGLAIHGGIIAGFLTAIIYTRIKKERFIKYADAAVPAIIFAQSLGRWGNFFNSEAHGGPVSYEFIKHFPLFIQKGMYINSIYYHPTFLYESIWNLLIFAILMILLRKKVKDGMPLFSYIGLYSLGRFFIEGLRTDSLMLGSLRMAQVVSLAGVVLWILFVVLGRLYFKKEI